MPPYKKKSKFNIQIVAIYLLIGVIVSSIIVWIYNATIVGSSDLAYNISSPIKNLWSDHNSGYWDQHQQIVRQKRKIKKLQNEITILQTQNSIYKTAISEKQKLESLLAIKQTSSYTGIVGRAISRSPSSWHRYIVIDRGNRDGIKSGMVVISTKGVVGQIANTYHDHANVNLLYSGRVQYGGQILRNGLMGVIEANPHYGYANLKYIPIGSDVKVGDIVRTATLSVNGLHRAYPSSYPIGIVTHVKNNHNNTQVNVIVKLTEDYSKLDYIMVLN